MNIYDIEEELLSTCAHTQEVVDRLYALLLSLKEKSSDEKKDGVHEVNMIMMILLENLQYLDAHFEKAYKEAHKLQPNH